jgi:hypothetical protein
MGAGNGAGPSHRGDDGEAREGSSRALSTPTPSRPSTGRKTARTMPRKPSVLVEPILIAEWKKNRGADVVRVILKNFNGYDLVDLRTWFNDQHGGCRPGKGFCCQIRQLPLLVRALNAALHKSRELGLLPPEGEVA